MKVFDDFTFSVLKTLNESEVLYMIVGGYAVNFHGYARTTGDVDLWLSPDNGTNKEKFINALDKLGIAAETLEELKAMDFTIPQVFSDGQNPFRIDYMTRISGVDFNEAWQQKITTEIDGLKIPFINLKDLVVSKISSDRSKDKLDVETLQKIQQEKKKN